MALTVADIKVFKAANNSDTTANGGAITTNEIVDVVGALFPNVDNAERVTGSEKWRKMFFKIGSNDANALMSARVYQDVDTQGQDIILIAKGTKTDTQAQVDETSLYASVGLDTSVLAGGNSISVNIPPVTNNWFKVGQTIRVTDKLITDGTGSEEFFNITNISTSGSVITITLSDVLANNYVASVTRVMNVMQIGTVVASATNLAKTSVAGMFNLAKVTVTNRATVDASWTLTFTASTTFTVTSSLLASGVVGNTGAVCSINNPTYTLPYLSIDPSGFTGTFATGDVVSFETVSATVPIWLKRMIPAGAAPVAINKAYFVLDGGSV